MNELQEKALIFDETIVVLITISAIFKERGDPFLRKTEIGIILCRKTET